MEKSVERCVKTVTGVSKITHPSMGEVVLIEMLGKIGVSGVFIGRERASPGSDGGSKSRIRGYGGSKIWMPTRH